METSHDDTHDAAEVGGQYHAERVDHPDSGGRTTLALISDARRALAEAATLPDIRRVMEAASVAADAGRRAAKLARARDLAADVVRDAEAAANDAAAVRIEAQAKAGELLKQMAERGERARAGDADGRRQRPSPTLGDLGVTKSESSRWQHVAAVPADTRQQYVEETKAAGEEISTDGLLQHADAARGASALADAVERYPFLADVPGHPPARLLEIAATLDGADEGERPAMEDQARRWCDAQRELVPQWKAEDEVTRMADGIISRLAHVNATLGQRGVAAVAEVLASRIMPDNDIAIVSSAAAHLCELERALSTPNRIRRVK